MLPINAHKGGKHMTVYSDYTSTKGAAEALGISASNMRLYGKLMEELGYSFKKVNNARQFSMYDLQLIQEARERHSQLGGTIKDAFNYVIVKDKDGVEVAEELEPVNDNELPDTSDVAITVNRLEQTFNKGFESLLEAIQDDKAPNDKVLELEAEIESLRASEKELKNKLEDKQTLVDELQHKYNELSNMSMWEFRKWKKGK